MYKFGFEYYGEGDSYFSLPLPPEEFNTNVGNRNNTVDLLEMGEVNIVKDVGLRDFDFTVLLPKDNQLCEDKESFKEPIFYLNKFREFKEKKKKVIMTIIRTQQDGTTLFAGNVQVTLEEYKVSEKAGEEGDFWVDLSFKEYKNIQKVSTNSLGTVSADGKAQVIQEVQRATKPTAKQYTVKEGDTLWKIAKLQLNDDSRYKEIANLNGITDYNNLTAGTVLRLP